jgi:hypothetical protein
MSTQPCPKARGVNTSTQTRLTAALIVVRMERRLQELWVRRFRLWPVRNGLNSRFGLIAPALWIIGGLAVRGRYGTGGPVRRLREAVTRVRRPGGALRCSRFRSRSGSGDTPAGRGSWWPRQPSPCTGGTVSSSGEGCQTAPVIRSRRAWWLVGRSPDCRYNFAVCQSRARPGLPAARRHGL